MRPASSHISHIVSTALLLAFVVLTTGCGSEAATPSSGSQTDGVASAAPPNAEVERDTLDDELVTIEGMIAKWSTGEHDDEVYETIEYAEGGCIDPAVSSFHEAYLCSQATLIIAEEDLQMSGAAYFGRIENDKQPWLEDSAREGWRRAFSADQQAWQRYRSATCARVAYEYAGGNGGPTAAAECMAEITRQRARALVPGS